MATINQVMVGGQLYDLQPVNIDETLEDIINKEEEERTPFDVAGSMSVKELNDKVENTAEEYRSNVATIENTNIASKNYSNGEFVIVGGKLYKVTSAIQTGDMFAVGTNVVPDTIGGELTQINQTLTDLIITVTKHSISIPVNQNVGIGYNGYVQAYGGTNGTIVNLGYDTYNVPANTTMRFPVCAGEGVARYNGGINSACNYVYSTFEITH